MSARDATAATSDRIGLITLIGGAIAGGAVAYNVATSGQAGAMPEELTRMIWYAIRVTGVAAYVALWLTTIAGICISGGFGGRWLPGALLYPLHQLGDLALSLMVLHAALLLGDHYAKFTPEALVVPFVAVYRPLWTGLGIIALYLCAIVFWSVHLRQRVGYRTWRAIHLLSFVAFFFALAHGFASGTDSASPAMRALYFVTGQIAIGLVTLRLWRVSRRRPDAPGSHRAAEARA